MKILILIITLILSSIAMAVPVETVIMKGSTKSIHLQQADNYNLFQLCTEIEEGIVCKRIGSATDQELIEITKKERKDATIKAWVVIPAWIVSTGLLAVATKYIGSTELISNRFPIIGLSFLTTMIGAGTLPLWLKTINPWYQFNQANILDDVAGEAIAEVSDRKVVKAANLLQSVLN